MPRLIHRVSWRGSADFKKPRHLMRFPSVPTRLVAAPLSPQGVLKTLKPDAQLPDPDEDDVVQDRKTACASPCLRRASCGRDRDAPECCGAGVVGSVRLLGATLHRSVGSERAPNPRVVGSDGAVAPEDPPQHRFDGAGGRLSVASSAAERRAMSTTPCAPDDQRWRELAASSRRLNGKCRPSLTPAVANPSLSPASKHHSACTQSNARTCGAA